MVDILSMLPGSMTQISTGNGISYMVQTPTGVLYHVFIDGDSDVKFTKSLNNGRTWSVPVTIFSGTVAALSIWYDKWSGLSGGLIHCAYTESVADDTLYRTINTESADALSTQTTIFAGASSGSSGHLTITRARGGNVYCKTVIDNGLEGGFFRLPNANVPNGAWDAARTINEVLAAFDYMILVPGFAADNQDVMCIFWDTSADEISRQIYDDSANTWAETSIATSMVESITGQFHFAAAVDLTNSQIVMVAWSGVDIVNADLRCWTVTETTISEKTNVVLNSTDDQGMCAIGIDIDTDDWYVYYFGKSDGSETYNSWINLYRKISTDGGTTWSAQEQVTLSPVSATSLFITPRFQGRPCPVIGVAPTASVLVPNLSPRATLIL